MRRILYSLSEVPTHTPFVVTQGTFDGVHLGHRQVLSQVIEKAKSLEIPSLLLTFHPHPRLVINPNDNSLQLLSSIDEKCREILKIGIDYILVLPFTKEISELNSEEFVKSILVDKLHVQCMIVGYDHRFGKNRSGSFESLKELSAVHQFSVLEIAASEIDAIAISSTRIRKALIDGNLTLANQLLGRPYSLSGKVVQGKQLGRTIGFPTANLKVDESNKLIPKNGVYIGIAHIGTQKHKCMLNIGTRPTVDGTSQTIEAHILNFNSDIYNETITLELVQFLREERRFAGLDELKLQLEKDKIATENSEIL